MKNIHVPPAQLKAVKDFLLDLNLCNKNTANNKVIQTALNLLLYGEASLREAQESALKRLGIETQQPFDQARLVQRWAQHSTVLHSGGAIEPPDIERAPELEAALRKTEQDMKKMPEPPPLYRDEPEEVKLPQLRDYKNIPFMPLKEIKIKYPKHPLLKFAARDSLSKKAVEAAFGVMPLVLHKSAEISKLAENLYKSFKNNA